MGLPSKKIKSIRLQRFRQFEDTTIEVGSFNLLVGPNNSGKTTILHAIRAFYSLMNNYIQIDGSLSKFHPHFLSNADDIAPTPNIKELWFAQKTGRPISISLTFEDSVTIGVNLRSQFGQLHVSSENLPPELSSNDIVSSYLGPQVAFIPGLVGVLVSEPYATPARRNALAAQGRYSEIFRSSLRQLIIKDDSLLERINKPLMELFGIDLSYVDFNDESDEFVTVKYKQKKIDYDVVSSGAGLQQVIQMLTYLYYSQPKILLIDEPDAHLHSKLQARLGELFRRVAEDLDAQVFLSTHSLDLIDTFSTNQVIVVDSTRKELKSIGKNSDLVSALIDADVVDVSALSRLLSSRKLVIVEDKDQTILKTIDKACGGQLYSSQSSSYVLTAKGVSNFPALKELGNVLLSLTDKKFDITFVQDRDGMPEFLVNEFLESQKVEGITASLLERHEIENYLIEPALIVKAASIKGRSITEELAIDAILKAAVEYKPKALNASLNCAELVNRHLQNKYNVTDLREKVFKWFDELNINDLHTIQTVFPGKELVPEILKLINTPGQKQITSGNLIAAFDKSFIPQEMKDLLASLSLAS